MKKDNHRILLRGQLMEDGDDEVQSKGVTPPRKKLRSPSVRRLPSKLQTTPPDIDPPASSPSRTLSQPPIDARLVVTERSRAILEAYKVSRKNKTKKVTEVVTPEVQKRKGGAEPEKKKKDGAGREKKKKDGDDDGRARNRMEDGEGHKKKTAGAGQGGKRKGEDDGGRGKRVEAGQGRDHPKSPARKKMKPNPPIRTTPPRTAKKVTDPPPLSIVNESGTVVLSDFRTNVADSNVGQVFELRKSPRKLTKNKSRLPSVPSTSQHPIQPNSSSRQQLPARTRSITPPCRPRSPTPPRRTRSPSPPRRTRSPTPEHDQISDEFIPPILEFESDDDSENHVDDLSKYPSIRCRSAAQPADDEGGEKKRQRGIVNGLKISIYKQTKNKGQPVKVEFLPDRSGPADQEVSSMLVHEIGSAVRDKVPMVASTFKKLPDEARMNVYDRLMVNFLIDPQNDLLWNYIFKRATERYRNWKSDCKAFFKEHGPDVLPREFVHRPEQWEWLKAHFSDPKSKKKSETMTRVRNECPRINHHSGKVPFYLRAAALAARGEKAPIVAAYSNAYSADPAGAAIAEKMREKAREALKALNGYDTDTEESVIDNIEPLSDDAQLKILSDVLGPKRGTYVAGAGRGFKRPHLPRGGARLSELTKKEMEKQREDIVKEVRAELMVEFEDRFRSLEDLLARGASAPLMNSEGATSCR